MLPNDYASALHLPFNATALNGRFRLCAPDRDPGGAGVLLLLRGNDLLVTDRGELPTSDGADEHATGVVHYCGQWDARPCRTAWLAPGDGPDGLTPVSLLSPEPQLPIELLSLGALARHILLWLKRTRYCGKCGGVAIPIPGHWGVRCDSCGFERFPDIHPCVIVLIRRGDELLLVRKPEWAPGRYGLVAGFLDFGECLEETVAREVAEETGLQVKNITYVGSQAWPFPSQLMTGFRADYAGGEISVQQDELEDARWFRHDELPTLPPKRSIARFLIDREVGQG